MSGLSDKSEAIASQQPSACEESQDHQRNFRPGCTLQKLSNILESKQFTDVIFHVGMPPNDAKIEAHRLVLSMYSRVFEAMFQGPLAADPGEVIEIPDVEPQAFQVLLKFIYTSEFDKLLPPDVGLAVLFAAHKYEIGDLELACTDYLKSSICQFNAVSVYQAAQLLNTFDLKNDAYCFITQHFDVISKTDDFLNMKLDNLATFLKDDDTRGQELHLFQGVIRWAQAECTRRVWEETPLNLRTVAEDAIKALRFPIMAEEDFALQVVPLGILSPEESTLLFQHMVVSIENRHFLPHLPFSDKKRNCSIYVAKFYENMSTTAYVDISAGWYNKFSVNQPVSIVSFGFYGPHSAEVASYQISIKLLKDSNEEVLGELRDQTLVVKMKDIFHVKFPQPIFVYPGITYRAWFAIKGPLTCHGATSKSAQEIKVPVNYSKYDHVKFMYNITGAHQLPEIAFQV